MNELIALLRQEQDIKEMIEQEKIKQERLEKTYHEQNISIYKNNSFIQDKTHKREQLYQQQTLYQNTYHKFTSKQQQYYKFIILLDLILFIIAPIVATITQFGMTVYIVFALIALLQIPSYYLYLYKENKILNQYNNQEITSNIKEISKELDTIEQKQKTMETEQESFQHVLTQSKKRLSQLNDALKRIEEQKNNIIFSVEYEETILPEEKTYQKKISEF